MTLLTCHIAQFLSESKKEVHVSRLRPFRSFMRAMTSAEMDNVYRLEVRFFDSLYTVDDGGPSREFMHLLLKDVMQPKNGIFQPSDYPDSLTLTHNTHKLENREYYWAGRVLAFLLVAGGPSVAVLTPGLYDCIILGFEDTIPTLRDIPSFHIRRFITKVNMVTWGKFTFRHFSRQYKCKSFGWLLRGGFCKLHYLCPFSMIKP